MTRAIPLIRASALPLLLLLAACGGGGGSDSSNPPPPPLPPPPPPALDVQYLASGPSPFAANCDGVANTGTVFVNAEVEPYVAIDPLNPDILVGAWQQDRWSDGSARGLMSATSLDGGQTWSRQPLPFSRCAGGNLGNGGDYARATDPWVAYAPDGSVHAIGLSTTGGSFQPNSLNAVLASRSTDHGRTWSAPATLIRDGAGFFNDKESLTADPLDARYVYAVWDRLVANSNHGPTWFARSTNGGSAWEAARPIYDPGANSQTIGNVIVVLPNGTLVNAFNQIDYSGNTSSARVAVIRSTDHGATWGAPIFVSSLLSVGARDPTTKAAVRDGAILPQIAVAPNGGLFVVWQDARFNNGSVDAIAISRSTDGGLSWSAPTRVNSTLGIAAFTPTVHVNNTGVVGVTYYDFRSDTATAPLLTDYWLARSSDNGQTWTERRASPSFDLTIAPNAGGLFLGDYQGLVSRNGIFIPFFVRTNNGDMNNRTDVFAAPQVTAGANAIAAITAARSQALAAERNAPPGFLVTPELRQAVSDNLQRARQARLLPWNQAAGTQR